ncbi:hypothetical protein PF327_10730 [Sulfurovum sp. XTW-4]|uniref:Holin n=1 Tax=Sulfurovum xiamenensis TaxID=3019066 RepID=A0ABT7QUC4_9BACT|nr:hypothetical protein [Sulfurovum xiamenensis]MDM5264669.1 hypothetical protein [Sulfurovum xiamenensis]
MNAIKNIVIWFITLTEPMRAWKYGEDGKYVHLLIGAMTTFLAVLISDLSGAKGLNFVGLSLLALAVGIAIEKAQRLLGGINTIEESIFDGFWTWNGGNAIALIAVYAELARWAW